MSIVPQFAPLSHSLFPPHPLLPAPKVVALLPVRVPLAPVFTVHRDLPAPALRPFPTPDEMDFDIFCTIYRVFERIVSAQS